MEPLFDSVAAKLAACPLCKTPLVPSGEALACEACGTAFGRSRAGEVDLRVHRPDYVPNAQQEAWADGQRDYETWEHDVSDDASTEYYLEEIDSVVEIYRDEFDIAGTVIDVGGGRGTLRHFLDPSAEYLCVDPFSGLFDGIERQAGLLEAYPRLREPCRFVLGSGEYLPVGSGVTDWVHMRSTLDHMYDPFIALWEAKRVLKPGGALLLGVTTADGNPALPPVTPPKRPSAVARVGAKWREGGAQAVAEAASRRLGWRPPEVDHHMWHPTAADVERLVADVGFAVERRHWQKAPSQRTLYVLARKA